VSTPAVFSGLHNRLINPANELVVFDINHRTGIDGLLTAKPMAPIQPFMACRMPSPVRESP
jgi:hypothetical protein